MRSAFLDALVRALSGLINQSFFFKSVHILRKEAEKATQLTEALSIVSELEKELSSTRQELEQARSGQFSTLVEEDLSGAVGVAKSIPESDVKNLRAELVLAKADFERSYARGRDEAKLPAIREFLRSPFLDALVRVRSGPINQSFFFKSVHQLISAGRIPGQLTDYIPHMDPHKNIYEKDYKPSSLPVDLGGLRNHEFTALLDEFGSPMPNPDMLEAFSFSKSEGKGEEETEVDIENDSDDQEERLPSPTEVGDEVNESSSGDIDNSSSDEDDSDDSDSDDEDEVEVE